MKLSAFAVLLLVLTLAAPVFSQSSNATVSGTVQDATGALIPGVSVTATNNATGVVTTAVTNEAGAYNFASLLPGVYTVSAELPGFQTRTFTDVQLGNAARIRLNFTLSVSGVNTAVEVTVAADTLLAASSQSVGGVLSQQRVAELPTLSNNVMELYRTIPGVYMQDNGVRGSFAGLEGFGTTNITVDGVDAQGGARWTANALTATHLSQEWVEEVKIIVAPVDAELGRGNAQIQFLTRSGTNQFRGSAVWRARNSALDANTWNNNRQVDDRTGQWSPVTPDWHNVHNFTASIGGPLVRNKTFFFALWDQAIVGGRRIQNPMVLTPCARNGIFRYYDNWNNGNALQVTQATGGTPTIAVVDALGNPMSPGTNPNGTAHNGTLRYASVFGPLANVPTRPDCSDAIVQGNPWDTYRRGMDGTGFIQGFVNKMPAPNNYEIGDGLNTAGHRWLRNERDGTESIFALSNDGLVRPDQLARKQINVKLDHNFNQSHKLSGTYTYEDSYGTANYELFPDGFRGQRFRRPQVLSVNFTSTLSPSLLNELRIGWRRTGGNSFPGIHDPVNGEAARAFYPSYNGYPVFIGPGAGQINYQGNFISAGGTSQYNDVTQQVTWADSLSWTKGTHAFKFGGEVRRSYSRGFDAGIANTSTPRALGGDAPGAAIPTSAISSANIPGLAGSTSSGNNQRMRHLMSFLAGSLNNVRQFYYMQDPTKLDAYEDFLTYPQRERELHRNELSLFFKDDWKATTNLTLNVGFRWDWYGSIYEQQGLLPNPIGGTQAMFGISGRSFAEAWMKPGHRAEPTRIEYVGKNSPNPDTPYFPNDWNNFGPAVGFAWQVPWLGAGQTTVRGGYQMTFNGTPSFNSLTQINNAPGSTLPAVYSGDSSNPYLDLTKVSSLIPVPQIVQPMEDVPTSDRTQTFYVPDPNLETPYVQNITLSLTRSIGSNMTLDLRYLGTLGRKQWNVQFPINQPNFLFNGLKDAFDSVRAGGESDLLNQMFNGINVAGSGYGPVGTVRNGVEQTAGMHLRAFSRTRAPLANGDYQGLANVLDTLNYVGSFNPGLPPVPAGVNGAVMRHNGFPENFIRTNPQFANVHIMGSMNSNNYHAMEASFTFRPSDGITMQNTYTWSKNLGIFGEVGRGYVNPFDRHGEYAVMRDSRNHDFRTHGTFTLPIGPNRTFFGNSTGALARILEDWSTSWIVTLTSGEPMSIAARSGLYTHLGAVPSTADIVGPFNQEGKIQFTGSGAAAGSFFDTSSLTAVRDPQCNNVTTAQNLQAACTLNAIADAGSGQVLLQNPLPGSRGNLALNSLEGPGRWRFDASAAKKIRLGETRSLTFRLDAINVMNHPEPNTATNSLIMNINNPNFGLITGANAKTNLRRQFQAQLRLDF